MENKSHSDGDLKYVPLDPDLVWTSYDMGCSAALICVGFELLSLNKDQPHKSLFIFKRSNGIDDDANLYWADKLKVNARSYFDTIKMLKNRLYS